MLQAPMIRAFKAVWIRFGWEVGSWAGFCMLAVGMFVLVQTAALVVCYGYEIPLQKRLRSLMVVGRSISQAAALR
jgi:hypothetical protein